MGTIDVEPGAFILLIGLTSILAVNNLLPLALMFAGLLCFIRAKLSLIRRGVWLSWGSRRMAPRYARLYKFGYGLILAGVAISCAGPV
jgi:hypothetical protein